MHQVILAQRKSAAIGRIVERATALVHQLELDPALAEALLPTGIKDAHAAEMIRLESLANLMDRIAENAGVPAAAVTTVTINEFRAPTAGEEALTIPLSEDPLPLPVLDEDLEPKSKRKTPRK